MDVHMAWAVVGMIIGGALVLAGAWTGAEAARRAQALVIEQDDEQDEKQGG